MTPLYSGRFWDRCCTDWAYALCQVRSKQNCVDDDCAEELEKRNNNKLRVKLRKQGRRQKAKREIPKEEGELFTNLEIEIISEITNKGKKK